MDEIILIGAGGHARSCIDVVEMSDMFKIAGLVEKNDRDNKENLGYPVIGVDKDLPNLRKKYSFSLITIGQIKFPTARIRLFSLLKELDYHLPTIISPIAPLQILEVTPKGKSLFWGHLKTSPIMIHESRNLSLNQWQQFIDQKFHKKVK